jgi:hypothetical protein
MRAPKVTGTLLLMLCDAFKCNFMLIDAIYANQCSYSHSAETRSEHSARSARPILSEHRANTELLGHLNTEARRQSVAASASEAWQEHAVVVLALYSHFTRTLRTRGTHILSSNIFLGRGAACAYTPGPISLRHPPLHRPTGLQGPNLSFVLLLSLYIAT